jgi:hypothetical protein
MVTLLLAKPIRLPCTLRLRSIQCSSAFAFEKVERVPHLRLSMARRSWKGRVSEVLEQAVRQGGLTNCWWLEARTW